MARSVRLFNVDHDEVRVLVSQDGSLRQLALIFDERRDLILVDCLELLIREVVEGWRAQTFRYPEIRLGRLEADMLVDVVDRGEDGGVPRNEVGTVTREANLGEIGADSVDI